MSPRRDSTQRSDDDDRQQQQQQRMEEMEAKAVDKAKANADAAFRPTPSVLNAQSAAVLLQQVDGPSLTTYKDTESVYVGRSVPVAAGGSLNVPINVSTPGSVVEYAVEVKGYDIGFEIMAEREEGVTVVKVGRQAFRQTAATNCFPFVLCCLMLSCVALRLPTFTLTLSTNNTCVQEHTRIRTEDSPITQKFLVGTVPCLLQFDFGNEYSWMRDKVVSYRITVTPPSRESLAAGRRRRAQACLKAVEDDLQTASARLEAASQQKATLQDQVAQWMHELEEKKKAWKVAEKEETWLKERKTLRMEQQKLLNQRLKNGWSDEDELTANAAPEPNGK